MIAATIRAIQKSMVCVFITERNVKLQKRIVGWMTNGQLSIITTQGCVRGAGTG